jgi:hypothetical protein
MTPEQFTALIVALTGLIAAVGAVWAQLRQTHKLMNGRMTELLDATKLSGQATGELLGRDFRPSSPGAVPIAGERIEPPTGTRPPSSPGINAPNDPATTP